MIKFENNQDFVQNFIKKPLIVNNLEIKNRLALAPLAGTSDTIFRTFSSQYGAGLVTTELVSAKGICYDPYLTKNYRYLEINPKKDSKIAIQLFGHEPYSFQKAIETILEHPILKECHIIDINMGCPVKKVVKQGAGSALMRTPELAEEIVKTARAITESHNKLLSVKFRSGWDQSQINAVNFAKRLEAVGAELITLHARTRKQMYQGKADWEIIKKVKAAVKIPVYGNGDLSDLDSIMKMYQKTGCDGFALGRAAQGNPWIFKKILEPDVKVSKQEWLDLVCSHLDQMIAKTGDEQSAIIRMRSQLAYYLRGKKNSSSLKNQLMRPKSKEEIISLLKAVEFDE